MTSHPTLGSNTKALITGGSSGIGLALARQLAQLGCHVWLAARGQERLQSALGELEDRRVSADQRFGITSIDLTKPNEVTKLVERVTAEMGAPNLLVNSAGIVEPGYFHDLDLDEFHSQMGVNYFAALYVIKAILPGMCQNRSGTIVNIASGAAIAGVFGYTAYSASKFALRGFSEALRMELKPHGIHVMLVYPPDTDTPQLTYDNLHKPPETKILTAVAKVRSPEEVSYDILKGIQRQRMSVTSGFDSKLLIRMVGLLGDGFFLYLEYLLNRGNGKVK